MFANKGGVKAVKKFLFLGTLSFFFKRLGDNHIIEKKTFLLLMILTHNSNEKAGKIINRGVTKCAADCTLSPSESIHFKSAS